MKAFKIAAAVCLMTALLCGCQQTPSVPAPEQIGVVKEDVDFLSAEQWTLLERGNMEIRLFELSGGSFGDGDTPGNPPQKVIDGVTYQKYTGDRYTGWDAFYSDMLTVFTPEYFAELNQKRYGTSGEADTYINVDGDLYYVSADRGANPTYLRGLDRYELTEAAEKRITFDLIAYYCAYDDAGVENAPPETMERCPVVLENTQGGWRIAKLTLPY